jgi:hypothetical protein
MALARTRSPCFVDQLPVGAHLAAEDAQRLDHRVDDAGVVHVALVQAAERDAAERLLAVVGVGEAVDGDEVEPAEEDRLVGDLGHDAALQRRLRLVGEVEEGEGHKNSKVTSEE